MSKLDFDTICEKVFQIDGKIRSARVINSKGKLIAGGMRQGLKALEESKKDEMLFMELSLRVRMRQEFDDEFGSVEFSLSYRGRIVLMSFPLTGHVLFVSTEREIDFNKIPFEILKIIRSAR